MHQILWQQQKTCLRNRHRIAHIANSMETHWTGPKSIHHLPLANKQITYFFDEKNTYF